jgi:hypothetical protein
VIRPGGLPLRPVTRRMRGPYGGGFSRDEAMARALL